MTFNFRDLIGGESAKEVDAVAEKKEERIKGRITRLKEDEGWGFISSKDRAFTRIFFHWTALVQDTLKFPELKKGMWVEFIPLEKEGRGINAIKVKVIERPKDEKDE